MIDRIHNAFATAKAEHRGALMPYVTAGDPDLAASRGVLEALERAGADLVEFGIPYSDPLADGPVIQQAAQRALAAGTTLAGVLELIAAFRADGHGLPLVIMTCFNPILQYGPERFATDLAAAGGDGVLITDLPPAESEEWVQTAAAHKLGTVFLVAPTTPPERVHLATEKATGFVYAVARAGVTGAREELPEDLAQLVAGIRARTDLPVAVGFGISTADHVRQVWELADGAIVGSALVKVMAAHAQSADLPQVVEEFVRGLRGG
ncbi:MAG: tryptophan synthase subunit alpha [Armatimonadetes bacterium]|nr:tryptophan synthase subunit alpha [Armatimonadota bacterium]